MARFLLSALLFGAGALHALRPEWFAPAIPFEPKLAINGAAGLIECALAIALWLPRWRDGAARATALWFLLLTPVHIYVSWKAIPMFGVSHPLLLWARTGLQGVLYIWVLTLQERGWLISQRWSDVLFLHYEVDAAALQEIVPYPLDLYQGKGIVSVVPFTMRRIRFPFLPPLPGLSKLHELNLRTYVRVNGLAAVYFFTLDSNHLPGVLVARWGFGLPYRWRPMQLRAHERYEFTSEELTLTAELDGAPLRDQFAHWATERYALVTRRGRSDLIGVVEHAPWELTRARVTDIDDRFSRLLGDRLKAREFFGVSYVRQLDVRFRPFRKLGP